MEIYSQTDIGKKRYSNQDAVDGLILTEILAWTAVCDGMGGSNGGDIASKLAIKKIKENMTLLNMNLSENEIFEIMNKTIEDSNRCVFEESKNNELLKGMGTTLILVIFKDFMLHLMNIGDSRAYLIRNNEIKQLSTDHSMVQEMINNGQITLEEAKNHIQKNIITKAIGINNKVEPDYKNLKINSGDIIILCSDGLSNHLSNSEIKKIVLKDNNESLKNISKNLIDKCNKRGGKDNITVSLLQI